MQGRRDLEDVAALIMSELTPVVSAQHGAFFLAQEIAEGGEGGEIGGTDGENYELRLIGAYGYSRRTMPIVVPARRVAHRTGGGGDAGRSWWRTCRRVT